uniref:Aminoglycoside phosphotransferase domain-containing protein n=1 Tax=Zooxanthella nutricula TaxID=1333877 RepID=A0A7S2M2B3_9DINO
MLRGDAKEYYMLLIRQHALIAGAHKRGAFGDEASLRFAITFRSSRPEDYNMNPRGFSFHEEPGVVANKLTAAIKFFAETAKMLFPPYVTTSGFQNKFRKTMQKLCSYSAEIEYWKHSDPNYVALGHQNLNMDNAYFWRTSEGALDCGIFDFGGFSSSSVAHRIWWGLNCAEFEQIKANLQGYIEAFVALYQDYGGPPLDAGLVRMMAVLTALQNLYFMVAAVPNCLTQCPLAQWETIKDRHDPRVASDVGGKSTLRTTLRVMDNGLRMLEELAADRVLDDWEQQVYVGRMGGAAKTAAMINGG